MNAQYLWITGCVFKPSEMNVANTCQIWEQYLLVAVIIGMEVLFEDGIFVSYVYVLKSRTRAYLASNRYVWGLLSFFPISLFNNISYLPLGIASI